MKSDGGNIFGVDLEFSFFFSKSEIMKNIILMMRMMMVVKIIYVH